MRITYNIIKKNIKVLIRSRISSLIIILGPLLLIFLVGIAFDNSKTISLNIGIYSDKYNDLTDSFVTSLKNESFNVFYETSEDSCINRIKEGFLHTCIVFPPDLKIDDGVKNDVMFYVDYSHMNLVYSILDILSNKLESKSDSITKDLTKILIERLENSKEIITEQNKNFLSVKSTNEEVLTANDKIKTGINPLNTDFNTDDFNVKKLKITANALVDISNNVDLTLSQIDSLESKINAFSNVSASEKTNALSKLNDTRDTLNLVKNLTKNSDYGTAGFSELISTIEIKVNDVKSNFDQVANVKNSVNEDVNTITLKSGDLLNKVILIEQALTKLKEDIDSIKVTSVDNIVSPINTKVKPIIQERSRLNYIFPSLMVLIIMFISLILSSTLVMMERHSPAYFRNLITPTSNFVFVLSLFMTNLILVAIQIAVIVLISLFYFKTQLIINIYLIILVLFMITALFSLMGMIIGYLFKSEETEILGAISLSALCLFLSDVILPIETMPSFMIKYVGYNPFVFSQSLLRKVLLFNQSIYDLKYSLGYFSIVILVLFIIVWILHGLSNANYLNKTNYLIHRDYFNFRTKFNSFLKKRKEKKQLKTKKRKEKSQLKTKRREDKQLMKKKTKEDKKVMRLNKKNKK